MRLLNRKFDNCEWHEHLKENEIICDDNTVYIVSADADDSNGLEICKCRIRKWRELFYNTEVFTLYRGWVCPMIFITDELGKFEKNIIELAENMGLKECKTIEAIDLFVAYLKKTMCLRKKTGIMHS